MFTSIHKGNPDYVKYWSAVELFQEEYEFSNLKEGFQKLHEAKTVMSVPELIVRQANKQDPNSMPAIKVFGAGKYSYQGIAFTRNSPLVPIFKKAAIKSFECGHYQRILMKWVGDSIKSKGGSDTMILSIGQTFIAFIFMISSNVVALIILLLECSCYKLMKNVICV